MRRSSRRRVTPWLSRWVTSGMANLRDVPQASRMAATVTPSGEAASSPATTRAAASIADAAK